MRVVGLKRPDGVVEPRGPTFLALTSGSEPSRKRPAARPRPPHVTAFIEMALPTARAVQQRRGVPVAVLMVQAALESGWGRHVKGNASFRIKGKSPSGTSITFATKEVIDGKVIDIQDEFRAYRDFAEAADDYGRFLNENKRYQLCFLHKADPFQFVQEIAKAGYATDTNYAASLRSVIRLQRLQAYDAQ